MQEYKVVPLSEYEYSPTMISTGINYGLSDYAKDKSIPLNERMDNINRYYDNERKQIDNDLNKYLAKQYAGAALQIGSAAIPVGAGLRLGAGAIKALTPRFGKAIATEIGSGLAGGALGGAVEGFGRGLVEGENPFKTSLQDGSIGLITGGALGGAVGRVGQAMAKRNLPNNPAAQQQYFADYVEGLSNNAPLGQVSRFDKGLADFRLAREGNVGGGTGTLFDILKDKNGNYLKLLHGTSGIFENFDKSKLGSLTGAKSAKKGFWFTDGTKTAQSYADYSAENSELNKLLRKQKAIEKMPLVNWDEYDKLTEEIENLALKPQPEPRIIKAYLDMNNPVSFDAKGKRFMEIQEDLNNFLDNNQNADGFIINNLRDAVNPNVVDEAATHYMVREPNQIKIIKDDITSNLYDKLVDNYNPEIEQIAKDYFGLTNNTKEAVYILNDGSLLDFSGKKFGGPVGTRTIDHREIVDAFLDNPNNTNNLEIGFDEFIDNGAVRYMPENKAFFLAKMPSEKQIQSIKNLLNKNNGESRIELVPKVAEWGHDNNFKKDYAIWSDPNKIIDDIRTYFKGGKISDFKDYL